MAIEIFLIAVGVVLFGGLFLGLFLSYTETEAAREGSAKERVAQVERRPALYGWEARNAAIAEELMLRQIEHHLRREAMLAEQFVMDPNPHTLRAGDHVGLGAN